MKTTTVHKIGKKILSGYFNKKMYYLLTHLLSIFLSDRLYLKIMYRIRVGSILHLKHPVKFTEKIQWLKLNNRSELLTVVADKYSVRDYIAGKIGREYLLPMIGAFEQFDDIDFDNLPNSFILKACHGSGWNIICLNKNDFDKKKARKYFNLWMNTNYYWPNRSWEYKNIKPRIVCEEFISSIGNNGMDDYKIHCFNGKPTFIQLISDRSTGMPYESFYNEAWEIQKFTLTYPLHGEPLSKPSKLSEMLEIARELSAEFVYARIDLYINGDVIYFGEITLRPASGLDNFTPKSYDEKLGKLLNLKSYLHEE